MFLSSIMSRLALGPAQMHTQWVLQQGCEADHSPPVTVRIILPSYLPGYLNRYFYLSMCETPVLSFFRLALGR
jgi:hypothetical protein